MTDETLLTLASDIVSAHVSNNSVGTGELPELIKAVYDSLAGLGKPAVAEVEKREPAVSIRSSIKPESITCLECGVKLKMLKRHIGTDHNLSPAEYRARWGLSVEYPLVAPEYAAKRKALAVKIGLGHKPVAVPAPAPAAAEAPAPKPRGRKPKAAPAAE